ASPGRTGPSLRRSVQEPGRPPQETCSLLCVLPFLTKPGPCACADVNGRCLLRERYGSTHRSQEPWLQWSYFIPSSAATPATRFAASLLDIPRVSCRKRIAFSRSPVRTIPYSRISHLASTPGAAALSHSTRTFPSEMPQRRIRRWSSG